MFVTTHSNVGSQLLTEQDFSISHVGKRKNIFVIRLWSMADTQQYSVVVSGKVMREELVFAGLKGDDRITGDLHGREVGK